MKGKIIQVMGPVVDVEFDGYLPEINEAIDVVLADANKDRLVLEVAAHIGDSTFSSKSLSKAQAFN